MSAVMLTEIAFGLILVIYLHWVGCRAQLTLDLAEQVFDKVDRALNPGPTDTGRHHVRDDTEPIPTTYLEARCGTCDAACDELPCPSCTDACWEPAR